MSGNSHQPTPLSWTSTRAAIVRGVVIRYPGAIAYIDGIDDIATKAGSRVKRKRSR